MSLADEMTKDFLSLREEVPVFLLCGKTRVQVMLSQAACSEELEVGGFAPKRSLTASVLFADLPQEFGLGRVVSMGDTSYRVEGISRRPGLPLASIDLVQL